MSSRFEGRLERVSCVICNLYMTWQYYYLSFMCSRNVPCVIVLMTIVVCLCVCVCGECSDAALTCHDHVDMGCGMADDDQMPSGYCACPVSGISALVVVQLY